MSRRYTELELSLAAFDQPAQDHAPTRKVLILSPPRTGSYMLCRMMLHAGLGIPHEYFNDIHITLIGQRSGTAGLHDPGLLRGDPRLLLRYLHHLYAVRTRRGVFAAKIQYRQFHDFLRGSVGVALFEGASLVYLTREDIVAQAVSLHLAETSGRWSFEQLTMTAPRPEGRAQDMAAIADKIAQLREEEMFWEQLFFELGEPPLRLTYEELCEAPSAVLARVATWSGIAPETVAPAYDDEGRYPADPGLPAKDVLAARFRQMYPDADMPRPAIAPPVRGQHSAGHAARG